MYYLISHRTCGSAKVAPSYHDPCAASTQHGGQYLYVIVLVTVSLSSLIPDVIHRHGIQRVARANSSWEEIEENDN